MDKEAQIADALAGAGSSIMESLKNAPDNISMFWDALSDNQKNVVINSLAGAAAGGLGSGILGGDLSDSLVAAALGGAAGGGLTLGYNTLFGGSKLPSELEDGPNVLDRGLSAVGNPILGNPGTSIGGALGAAIAAKRGGLPFSDALTEEQFQQWASKNPDVKLPTKALLGTADDIKAKNLLAEIERARSGGSSLSNAANILGVNAPAGAANPLKPRTFSDLIKDISEGKFSRILNPELGKRSVIEKAVAGQGIPMPRRAAWLALPAGLGAGAIADKYIQGEI